MIPAALDHNLLYSAVGLTCKSHCHNRTKKRCLPQRFVVIFTEFISCVARLGKTVFWASYRAAKHTTDVTVMLSILTLPGYCQSIFVLLPVTWINGKLKLNWTIYAAAGAISVISHWLWETRLIFWHRCEKKKSWRSWRETGNDNDWEIVQQTANGKKREKERKTETVICERMIWRPPLSRK